MIAKGLGDAGSSVASIWNTPGCSLLDSVYMSDSCANALDTSFYGTSTALINSASVPTIGSPVLTQSGVGVNVPGNDYSSVSQSLSDSQIQSLQKVLGNAIDSTSVNSIPWYWWALGGLAAVLVIREA